MRSSPSITSPGQFMVIAFESVKRAQELIQDVLRHRLDVAPQRIKRLAIVLPRHGDHPNFPLM